MGVRQPHQFGNMLDELRNNINNTEECDQEAARGNGMQHQYRNNMMIMGNGGLFVEPN